MNAETESNSKLNPVLKELFLIMPDNNVSELNLLRYFSALFCFFCIFSFSSERSLTLTWHLQGNLTKSIQHVFGSANWKMIQRLMFTQIPYGLIPFSHGMTTHNQS